MINSTAKKKTVIMTKAITVVAAVAIAIVLPQFFHLLGIASGLGSSLGASFLPMHLPVFISGLVAGPIAGLVAGIVSPILSFGISGMPVATMLPFMTIELACYGVVCGFLSKVKMPAIFKLLSAQVIGRLVRSGAILIAVYGFNIKGITAAQAWNVVLIGLPGIVLQWALIPLIIHRMKGLRNYYE